MLYEYTPHTTQRKHPIRIPLQFETEVFVTSGSGFYTPARTHYKTQGSRALCSCVNIALKWVPVAPKPAIFRQPPAWLAGRLIRLPRERVWVFPGVIQFSLRIGTSQSQWCVRGPSALQSAIGARLVNFKIGGTGWLNFFYFFFTSNLCCLSSLYTFINH